MKKTITLLILAAAAAFVPSIARAGDHCLPLPVCHYGAPLVRAWPGYAGRDIRAVSLYPFSPAPVYYSPAPAVVYYQAPSYPAIAYAPPPPPAPENITITITVPVSVARQLITSGAIKLPRP